eukprot:1186878-Prorocentrum_minimum.AAC.3
MPRRSPRRLLVRVKKPRVRERLLHHGTLPRFEDKGRVSGREVPAGSSSSAGGFASPAPLVTITSHRVKWLPRLQNLETYETVRGGLEGVERGSRRGLEGSRDCRISRPTRR